MGLHRLVNRSRKRLARLVAPAVRAASRRSLARHGLLDMLDAVGARRPPHALAPDYCDLLLLYEAVRRRRPRTILEFGSGWSTCVLARALADNVAAGGDAGFLHSLESDRDWAAVTVASMPAELSGYYACVHSPAVEVEWDGVAGYRHANVPDIAPDMIFLDGPPLTSARNVAVDVLDIEARLPADFLLLIDKRNANARFLRERLARPHRYACHTGPLGGVYSLHAFEGMGATG